MIIPIYGMRWPPGSRADQRQAWPIGKLTIWIGNLQACDIISGAVERHFAHHLACQSGRQRLTHKGQGNESGSGFVQRSSGGMMLDRVGCLLGAVGIGK